MTSSQRLAGVIGLLVLLLTATVYFITLFPTVPFWDAGEFIAVAHILGIPHPPGTPFFVLVAKVFSLLPIFSGAGAIAQRVNALSAVSGALAVWLTYLTILRLVRRVQGDERQPHHEWIAIAGAFTGALLLAFSDAFWENAIEAEVYQLMSLAQILVFWLGLRWWEAHDRKPTVSFLLVATYVMWLCVGLHLGVGIMGLPLFVLAWMVDRRVALLFAMPFLTLLRVPAGLEKMIAAVLLLSFGYFAWMTLRRQLNGVLVAVGAVLAAPGFIATMGDADLTPATAAGILLGLLVPLTMLAVRTREGRVLALSLFLMVTGYSTHLFLPIRAQQFPAINEGAPATWDKMRDLLERRQYGEMNPLVRRGKFVETQLDKEFWRYFSRQWPIAPPQFPLSTALPLLLGIAGGIWQWRERKSFATTFVFLGLSTAGMIFFLNFSDTEVRERDYFFQSGYHAYALWIGLGVAFMIHWVRESFREGPAGRTAAIAAGALLCTQPFLVMRNLWHTHDRRGNYVAHDYAYNMLAPLAPNSYVFTNGDNDTFPLWYIQEVEGFRKDVRVVNLSLLNTDWYIRQLRDQEPKVPIRFDDRLVEQLGAGGIIDSSGRVIYTNEIMVHHILESSRNPDGTWAKQPYFAVTVPEDFGYERLFRHEGLVNAVQRDTTTAGFDPDATRHAMYDTFRYRGLFLPDGSWDPKVYKDENAATLSRNYAAAHLQLAMDARSRGDFRGAIQEMERIGRMFPDFIQARLPLGRIYMEAGETTKTIELYRELARQSPMNPDVRYFYGAALAYRNDIDGAKRELDAALQADPTFGDAYFAAYRTLWDAGRREEALSYVERWLQLNPGDPQAAAILEQGRAELGLPPLGGARRLPPPVQAIP